MVDESSSTMTNKPIRSASVGVSKIPVRIAVSLLILLISFIGAFSWYSWYREKASQLSSLMTVLSLGAKSVDGYLRHLEDSLRALADDMTDQGDDIDLERAFHLVGKYKALHPELVNVTLIRPDGQILLTALARPSPSHPSLAQVTSFKRFIDELPQGRPLSIGQTMIGALTKNVIVPLRHVIRDKKGNITYIVSANLPADVLKGFWQDAPIVQIASLGLIRDDGFLLSRFPVPSNLQLEEIYGKPRTGALVTHLKANRYPVDGYVEGMSSLDGPKHLFVYRRLPSYPVTMFVTMPISVLIRTWLNSVYVPLLLTFLLCTGGIVAFRYYVTQQRALSEAQRIAHIGNWELNLQRNELVWSDEIYRIFEIEKSSLEPLYEGFLSLIHPDDRAAVDNAYTHSLKTHEPYSITHRLLMADGRIKYVHERCETIFDDQGTPMRSIGTVQDVTDQEVSKLALSQERQRLQIILETASDGIHILDEAGNLIQFSQSFATMLGYSDSEMLALNVKDWDAGLPAEELTAIIAKLIRKPDSFETKHRRKDGMVFDVEISARGMWFEGKSYLFASARNISDRKLAEVRLRRSEERYHSIFSKSRVPMLLIAPSSGAILDANKAASDFYGFDADTLQKMKISDINVASPEELLHEMEAARLERRAHFHFKHRLASGQIRNVEVYSGPVDIDGGVALLSIIHDETERRRLEGERRKLIRAVEQSPVSIVITNLDGNIEYVNPRFLQTTGYELDDVLGQNPRLLKSGRNPEDVYMTLWDKITRGEEWSGELCNKKKDGSIYWESALISPIFDEAGTITHFLGIKEDITKRREMDEKLRKTNAELEQFAYIASHDLRQPLRMVTSYIGLIEKRLGPDLNDDMKTFIGYAVGGAKRMDALIMSLLEYSRTGRQANPFEKVDLKEVIGDATLTLEVAIRESGATITPAPDFPKVQGDRSELIRLFQNLIGNAIKYHRLNQAPAVDIDCQDMPTEWVVRVRDNGIGMAPEDHDRAFAAFQRLVPKEEYEGTGIGLAICKKIVDHHQGRIWIESALGEGCSFFVALPKRVVF